MKSLTHTLRYDGATLARVHEMLASKEFREQVCDRQGVLCREVTITPAGDQMTVMVDQDQDAADLPSFAKLLVGERIHVVQKESWTSAGAASLEVTIPGKPGKVTGTISVVPDDTGVSETVNANIQVGVPLVGGKIEGLLTELLTEALDVEQSVGKEWLATHHS